MITEVDINEGGLVAKGFLLGYESVVFPAEYRGVSIRVRGVAIGDPTFLGAEFLLTGAHKAALSQITGEINVLSGLDAVDATQSRSRRISTKRVVIFSPCVGISVATVKRLAAISAGRSTPS